MRDTVVLDPCTAGITSLFITQEQFGDRISITTIQPLRWCTAPISHTQALQILYHTKHLHLFWQHFTHLIKLNSLLSPFSFCVKYIDAIYYVIKSLFPCIISLISNRYILPRKQERALLSNRDVAYIGGGKTELFVHYRDDCAIPWLCLAFWSQIYCFRGVHFYIYSPHKYYIKREFEFWIF